MTTARHDPAHILAAGACLGVLGDTLLRAPGAPGLNLALWSAGVALAAVVLQWRSGRRLSAEAKVLFGVGLAFSAGLAWRDAPALKLLAIASIAAAYGLPAFRSGAAWVRRSGIGGYVAAAVRTGAYGAGGAALTLAEVDWGARRDDADRSRWQGALATARGLVLAVPVVVAFGALFISADAVFARFVAETVRLDLDALAGHVVLSGFLAWVAAGYLRSFAATPARLVPVIDATRARLGAIEGAVLLGALSALFLAFVIVQFRYLFGGDGMVDVTPGLTYAEYARRGFFELVLVVALTLPLLLVVDWLLRGEPARGRRIFRALAAVQVALVFAVMASAVQRVRLYQAAYGLTESRFYASALLALLGVMLVLFVATVLRGRRQTFAFGTLAAAFATVAVLFLMNPDAIIARTNITRAVAAGTSDASLDAAYLGNLSGDAVPLVLAHYPALPPAARCTVARTLLRRWPAGNAPDVRNWSWSAWRAERAVDARRVPLQAELASATCA